jgi:hypothetical protein
MIPYTSHRPEKFPDPTVNAVTGISTGIFRIKEGVIAEIWGEANLMGLMQQLVILPGSA